jgi:hypothetical protein
MRGTSGRIEAMKRVPILVLIAVAMVLTISCGKEAKGLREELNLLKQENSFLKAENAALKKEMEGLYRKLEERSPTESKQPPLQTAPKLEDGKTKRIESGKVGR